VQVVECALLHRIDGCIRRLRQCDEDDGNSRVDRADCGVHLQAGPIREPEIEQNRVGRVAFHACDTRGTTLGHADLVLGGGKGKAHLLANYSGVVVDQE
jgi:hypothetical protein